MQAHTVAHITYTTDLEIASGWYTLLRPQLRGGGGKEPYQIDKDAQPLSVEVGSRSVSQPELL